MHHVELLFAALVDHQGPLLRQDGQGFQAPLPPLGIDLVRLGQGNQVPDGPGDHVAVSLQVAFAPLLCAEYSGYVTRNRRLFGENRDCPGFNCLHLDSQSTPIPL